MARMSPVLTSMITAVPPVAWEATISAARACSATYWTDSSRVSSSPVPGVAGVDWLPLGRATPLGDVSTSVAPALPARVDWYWYSTPELPSPSHPTVPTTGWASSPTGTTRWESGTRLIPLMARLVMAAATESGTRRAR